jgi:hypothetical protein
MVDVICFGRFYDFFEKRDRRWGIVRRQPIYEKDRLDPVDPSAVLQLDANLLNSFPEGYCHLAYLQARNGFKIKVICQDCAELRSRSCTLKEKPGWRAPISRVRFCKLHQSKYRNKNVPL